jgi:TonB-linked SusC/RagA family outer membrane protein
MKNFVKPLWLNIKCHKKKLMIMRNALLLILISAFQVVASSSYSQTKKLSVSLEEVPIKQVLTAIEKQSEFYFLYNSELINVDKKVSVSVENETINSVLDKLFDDNKVGILIKDKYIILTPKSVSEQDQKTISGKVTDENGEALIGATIVEKGTTHGTVTNVDGTYSLSDLSPDAVLVFSFVGMETREVEVGSQTTLNVTLSSEAIGLEEVVVTALGIKREQKALGYSVQEIKGEELQKVPGVDVGTSLTGKVAGVLVQNSSDFNVEPTITIRGEENPLIVIDGVPYANKKLNDIAAEDIESMSVLKGATASALYGFRGKSGAILITTKNGSTGKMGISFDLTTNTMFNAGFLAIPEKQSVYGRGNNGNYDKNNTKSWGPVMDGTVRTQWDPYLMEYRDYEYLPIGKDNFDNFLETGYITNNNVNVGFRSENIALRSSLNWTQQKGVYPNSKLNKYTYTFGGDINLDKFQLSSNMSYTKRESPNMGTNGYKSYDVMYSMLIYSPADYNILDYKDNYWMIKDQKQNWTYPLGNINNPYFDRYAITNEVSRDIFNTDLTTSYEIADWLKVTVRSGLDFYVNRGQIRLSQGSWTSTGDTGVPGIDYPWNGTKVGAYITGKTQGFSINSDLLLTGNKKFIDDKLDLEYLAGGNIYYRRDDNLSGQTTGGISIPGYYSLKASVNAARVGETKNAEQSNSVFGRLALSWNNFIFIDVTGRNDWVSTLAAPGIPKSDYSYFYPSISGSFVISELLPDNSKNWLDLLKVRSSWTTAKTPPGVYEILTTFSTSTSTWNGLNGATAPDKVRSSTILPEKSTTYEIGLQSIMFKKRLSIDVAYYNKTISDILQDANSPASRTPASGIVGEIINTDEERSRRGWDVVVNVTPVKQQDLQLDLAINWGTYKEIYTKIDPVNTKNNDRDWVKKGKRTDFITIQDFEYQPGTDALIWDNGLPKRSSLYTFYGYRTPDWIWGISSTLRYKDFSLFMAFDGVVGGLMNTVTESYMWQAGVHPESVTETRAQDVATGDPHYIGEGVKVVSGSATYDVSGNILTDDRVFAPNDVAVTYQNAITKLHASSVWGGTPTPYDIYKRTFLKLREISLTYTVPKDILTKMGPVKGASISFVGQNVFFWAKDFEYSDPDGGNENFSDPSVRYLGGNIKVTF